MSSTVVPNTACFPCLLNLTHLIQIISSLVQIPRPELGVRQRRWCKMFSVGMPPGTWLGTTGLVYCKVLNALKTVYYGNLFISAKISAIASHHNHLKTKNNPKACLHCCKLLVETETRVYTMANFFAMVCWLQLHGSLKDVMTTGVNTQKSSTEH